MTQRFKEIACTDIASVHDLECSLNPSVPNTFAKYCKSSSVRLKPNVYLMSVQLVEFFGGIAALRSTVDAFYKSSSRFGTASRPSLILTRIKKIAKTMRKRAVGKILAR